MKPKIWEVRMGYMDAPAQANTIRRVRASTVKEAMAKAEKAEKEFVKAFNEYEGCDGEKITTDKVIGVSFLCELDDE